MTIERESVSSKPDQNRSHPRGGEVLVGSEVIPTAGQYPVERTHLSMSDSTSFLSVPARQGFGMITESALSILRVLAVHYVLCRPQIQRICFAQHASGRTTRKHLSKLHRGGYLNKTRAEVPSPLGGSAFPFYYLSAKGAELLASYYDDPTYLAVNTKRPRADQLYHWCGIGNTHIAISEALSHHVEVELLSWRNEWETVNKEDHPGERYCLHSVLRESPPLSCSPDFGFVLGVADSLNGSGNWVSQVYYGEQDQNTSGVRSIAARKTPGYHELFARGGGKNRHFPEATLPGFRVLMVTTHPGRRNNLARAIADKPGADLWLFVCQEDLTPENFPYGDVFYDAKGEAGPLVRAPKAAEAVG